MKFSNTPLKNRGLIIIITVFILCLSIAYFFVKPAFNYLSGYLSKSEAVNANILLVEGWISETDIEIAYEEFKRAGYDYIVTTGLKARDPYFEISENGFLIFYTNNIFDGITENRMHSIEVDAFSELDGENMAHFNFYINDSLITGFNASKSRNKYKISYFGNLASIDSFAIHFTNDAVGDFGDRNLYVKEIIIDKESTIPYINSEFDAGPIDGKRRISNNYDSNAQYVRNILISLGMDSSKVIATSGQKVKLNRTLTSALAFNDWLKTTQIDIKGINIITVGTHARRTWMTYNRILDEKFMIGIISIPDHSGNQSRESKIMKTVRETMGILYYWFILIPY